MVDNNLAAPDNFKAPNIMSDQEQLCRFLRNHVSSDLYANFEEAAIIYWESENISSKEHRLFSENNDALPQLLRLLNESGVLPTERNSIDNRYPRTSRISHGGGGRVC